jgi:sugar/nucleoside kinase (ribokinase family)
VRQEHGVVTSVDLLAPGELGTFDQIEPLLPYVDFLLPNEDQVLGFSEEQDVVTGAKKFLAGGVGLVAVTRGGDGALLVTAEGTETIPAFEVEVVDTTGCGDAFSAGFLRGMSLDRTPREAAILGSAAAALVAQGLGSDHGEFDLAEADEFSMTSRTRA